MVQSSSCTRFGTKARPKYYKRGEGSPLGFSLTDFRSEITDFLQWCLASPLPLICKLECALGHQPSPTPNTSLCPLLGLASDNNPFHSDSGPAMFGLLQSKHWSPFITFRSP